MIYNNLKKNPTPIVSSKNIINYNFVDGPYVEILGETPSTYLVKFINDDTNQLVYQTTIANNHWAKASIKYFIKWRLEVYSNNNLLMSYVYNAKDKKIFISFESSSLGDTIAWMPYVEQFQKKHNCKVVLSTFKNFLFEEEYPEIEFVPPGSTVNGIYAMYRIGWFYNPESEPVLPNLIPLQKTVTNILGLEYEEIKPRIKHVPGKNIYDRKYVAIATNSTAGCKFWTRQGWQEVINFLYNHGYDVVNVSEETNPFNNCYEMVDKSMDNTMTVIQNSEFFIGLSSGLSWLAWALDKTVVMISNFTNEDHEFKCIRITDKSVCNGCWNKAEYKFDKGDWNWCPVHKNTLRMFECHKAIFSNDVIKMISPLIRT